MRVRAHVANERVLVSFMCQNAIRLANTEGHIEGHFWFESVLVSFSRPLKMYVCAL
jgi:hypothetical protein